MMTFRIVKTALINDVFTAAAVNGKFRVIGSQTQGQSAGEVKGDLRSVEIYYSNGSFGHRRNGPTQHDATYRFDLTVSAPAKVDLTVINDEGSSSAVKKVAIDAMQFANNLADDSMDEIADLIYQIIMDAENEQLQLDKTLPASIVIADRFISTIRKDEPIPRGKLVLLTGNMDLSVKMTEDVPGDESGLAIDDVDTSLQTADIIEGTTETEETVDTETKTGVTVDC